MSNADQTTSTTETRTPARRAAATAAFLSVGLAAAGLSVSLAPSTSSTTDATWALASQGTPATIEPQLVSIEERAAEAARSDRSSRSADPVATTTDEEPEPEIVGTRYTTAPLNVRKTPEADAKVVTVLDSGSKVRITDQKDGDYRQIVYKDKARWVTAEYLSKSKPAPKPAGPSSAACASGSGVERGLTANAVAVHRAVCNAFPSVTSYGGVRSGGGAHGSGRALDIMVSGSTGDQIAAYVRANAGRLGVSEVIWEQRIWTVQRSGDGWRWMSDRGSATANHYDHVHVTTY